MTIKEVEAQTGLTRSNVRFYEKEKLIAPSRNAGNGYREYSRKDVEDIKKIAYLRTLGLSIEDIRNIVQGKQALREGIERQHRVLEEQVKELNEAKALCERMLADQSISYEELQIERYVKEVQDYWTDNQPVFKLDSVSFLYLWGSVVTWAGITLLCLIIGILCYSQLPPEIPIQWRDGEAVSLAHRSFIFAYPAACVAVRYLLRPCLYVKLARSSPYGEMITEYLSNYICFAALSVEIFTLLFLYDVVQSIVLVLAIDTAVLLGLLFAGIAKGTGYFSG